MTINDLILYGSDRLKNEWYDTPKCDEMRQAFDHLKEVCMIIAYLDCINHVLNKYILDGEPNEKEHL